MYLLDKLQIIISLGIKKFTKANLLEKLSNKLNNGAIGDCKRV